MDCLCFVSLEFSFLSENNYLVRQYICAHTMLIKTPLLHQSFGPRVFLSLSISVFLADFLERKAGCITQEILASLLLSLSHH